MLLIGGSLLSAKRSADRSNGRIRESALRVTSRTARAMDEGPNIRQAQGDGFRWEGVELLAYKEEGSAPFKAITRQVLFQRPELQCELRYFEMQPGGHSTLERHEHVHAVMIFRGRGTVPRRRRGARGGRAGPCVHPADDLASVPREQGRAVRLSLHGERRARQAAASDRCAVARS